MSHVWTWQSGQHANGHTVQVEPRLPTWGHEQRDAQLPGDESDVGVVERKGGATRLQLVL